jgi:hypothetical protein
MIQVDGKRNVLHSLLCLFAAVHETELVEATPGVACPVIKVLIGDVTCLGHVPRACKEIGCPAFVSEKPESRVIAQFDSVFRAAPHTVERIFLACGTHAEVLGRDPRAPRALRVNIIGTEFDTEAAVVACGVYGEPVFAKAVAEPRWRPFCPWKDKVLFRLQPTLNLFFPELRIPSQGPRKTWPGPFPPGACGLLAYPWPP